MERLRNSRKMRRGVMEPIPHPLQGGADRQKTKTCRNLQTSELKNTRTGHEALLIRALTFPVPPLIHPEAHRVIDKVDRALHPAGDEIGRCSRHVLHTLGVGGSGVQNGSCGVDFNSIGAFIKDDLPIVDPIACKGIGGDAVEVHHEAPVGGAPTVWWVFTPPPIPPLGAYAKP